MLDIVSAVPMAVAALLSASYWSLTTIAFGFAQTLAKTASVQAVPVQNWLAVQLTPQAPQLRGSLLVSMHTPLQQVPGAAHVPPSVQGMAASSSTSRTSGGARSAARSTARSGVTGASAAASNAG